MLDNLYYTKRRHKDEILYKGSIRKIYEDRLLQFWTEITADTGRIHDKYTVVTKVNRHFVYKRDACSKGVGLELFGME